MQMAGGSTEHIHKSSWGNDRPCLIQSIEDHKVWIITSIERPSWTSWVPTNNKIHGMAFQRWSARHVTNQGAVWKGCRTLGISRRKTQERGGSFKALRMARCNLSQITSIEIAMIVSWYVKMHWHQFIYSWAFTSLQVLRSLKAQSIQNPECQLCPPSEYLPS